MRVTRTFIRFALACIVLAFFGCSDGGVITIVIDEDCKPKDGDGNLIDKLDIWTGAEVEWINKTTERVVITVDEESIFGTTSITLNAEETKVMTVQEGLSNGDLAAITPDCWEGPHGGPSVVVKDPPPGG